jgi:hypothetical protein
MRSRSSFLRCVAVVAFPMVAGMLGCATAPQSMRSGAGVPASEGTVSATAGDNGNTNVTIRVKHLAPPSKLAPDATIYVVWIQPQNGDVQNAGGMALNDNLEGSLAAVTPHRQFLLIVTPEVNGQVAQPTNEPVFTAEVARSN